MDLEKLVDLITKEVMKRIENLSHRDNLRVKEKILILGDDSLASNIKEILQEKYIVDLYDGNVNVDAYKAIVISTLCLKGLSNLALGLCNGNYESIAIKALFKGKKVYVVEEGIEYRKYMATSNKNLYKLYNEYEKKVEYNGVDILDKVNLINLLMNGQTICKNSEELICEKVVEKTDMSLPNKKLITEGDLRKLYMNGVKEVNILKNVILTPLAQDFIRINHLKLNRQ